MRYFIELAYDGSAFHGWQKQLEAASVQSVLETGLYFKAGLEGRVTGCGRTDTGVHARQFFAHFDLEITLDEREMQRIVQGLNSYLPQEIVIKKLFRVKEKAHARFDANSRLYKYFISTKKEPFSRHFSWYCYTPFDIDAMNRAAEILFEYEDFTSFAKLHGGAKTNICKIMEAGWKTDEDLLVFTIRADRFLRNMVRSIVGTMTDVGRGKITTDDFRKIIESKNRNIAGKSAPAHGLFLEEITYDWEKIIP